jgi:hypothetical protein
MRINPINSFLILMLFNPVYGQRLYYNLSVGHAISAGGQNLLNNTVITHSESKTSNIVGSFGAGSNVQLLVGRNSNWIMVPEIAFNYHVSDEYSATFEKISDFSQYTSISARMISARIQGRSKFTDKRRRFVFPLRHYYTCCR